MGGILLTWAAWLMAMVAPLVVRGIAAAGFVAVVYTGVDTLVNGLVTYSQTAWAGLPSNVLQLAALSGVPDCLGMIMGAYMTKFTMQFASGAAKYVFKPK